MPDGDTVARPIAIDGGASPGSSGEIARVYAEIAPELRRFVLGVVRDPELADDVMQATFVKAIEQGHQARLETSRGWLFQVAYHEALGSRRRRIARDQGQRRLAGFRVKPEASPEEGVCRVETVEAVRQALKGLPEEQQRVILARIYEDKTFAQIAEELGLPLGTVLTRMRRGLEKLRNQMRPGV